MTAIHNWFVLCDLDDQSSDTAEVARLTGLGNDLIAIADVHLMMLIKLSKPAGPAVAPEVDSMSYLIWMTLTSQMASELYLQLGNFGIASKETLGVTEKFSLNYSPMLMKMILSQKKLLAMA